MLTMRPPRRPMTRAAACAQKNARAEIDGDHTVELGRRGGGNGVRKKTAALLTSRSRPPEAPRRAARRGPRAPQRVWRGRRGARRRARRGPRSRARSRAPRRRIAGNRSRRRRLAGERERDRASHAHGAAGHERDSSGQFLDTLRTVWSHLSAMPWSLAQLAQGALSHRIFRHRPRHRHVVAPLCVLGCHRRFLLARVPAHLRAPHPRPRLPDRRCPHPVHRHHRHERGRPAHHRRGSSGCSCTFRSSGASIHR